MRNCRPILCKYTVYLGHLDIAYAEVSSSIVFFFFYPVALEGISLYTLYTNMHCHILLPQYST